ncbi:DUF3560 domain-containing protein [Sinomonas sp. JGH33]|uniref:DUF3560 domain-containing protein n=1 Tax=Sinomonas terricola TaxID=3110330 RepID=A0ABU5TB70_9MICC|nr:DUF3560 domain-containing protein [Sinomonas sp. JGH33]MEA5456928.1 DUF3560 domain-containing protein [Sinomonas sp. JGH33]
MPQSRDRLPKTHVIRRTIAALREAGFEAEADLSTETRSTAEVEADRIARQQDRVEALESKADRRAAAAGAAWNRERAAVEALPEGGEPIKVGHHSEARHRRAIERAHASTRAAVAAENAAGEAAARAATAARTTGARYSVQTVANRIEKLGADIRRLERQIVDDTYDPERGYRPATEEEKARRARSAAPRLGELRDQLAYWEGVRAEHIATGKATNHSRETIKPGDAVRIRGHWRRVVRANAKTVSVETGYSWTDKAPYHEITDHRSAGGDAA